MSFAENEISREELKRILTDKLYRLNTLYYIRDKNGKIVKFTLNKDQEKYILESHYRNINLKARQRGFSTLAVIDSFDDCLFIPNFEAGIIAHSIDDAIKLFGKAKLAYERLPIWLKKWRKPNTDRAGEYAFPNGSRFMVDTSFRGGTLSRLHVSELGKISRKYPEKAKEIITGAFEAVPINGRIDIESTAEGVGGVFYDICQLAMSKTSKELNSLEFKFHFFPWFTASEYQVSGDFEYTPELKEYFKYLEEEQGISLTKEQKNWYALKKESLGTEMAQEYPSYPEEAFLASGRPVFNQQSIAAEIRRVKDRAFDLKTFIIKDLEGNEHTAQVKIFRHPKPGMAFAVAGDPAEGLEDGDNSAMSVLGKDYEQYAAFAGKLDPDLFGALLVEVAKYFNNAIVAWEQNNHGHAVENSIRLRRYYNVYKRKTKEKIGEEIQEKIGWLNTVKSKMEMLDELKQAFRDGSLTINDEDTLREMLTVMIEEDGNIIVNGKDRVVSLGISIQAIKQAGLEGEFKAMIPGNEKYKDITQMTVEEKLRYYKRKNRR